MPHIARLALLCLFLFGCTKIQMIRTEVPASTPSAFLPDPQPDSKALLACNTGSPTTPEKVPMWEPYSEYSIGYAEFDDQGWAYQNDTQLKVIQQRIAADMTQHPTDDYLIMVFVHGWHHNAHDNDCNVQEFRQMVRIASDAIKAAIKAGPLHTPRRVIGIYAGWRGEVVDFAGLRYLTVLDRRNSAERVAKGSVRKLFADLHGLQRSQARPDKVRTVVIGHSFGGLIAFAALSEEMIEGYTLARLNEEHPCTAAEANTLTGSQSTIWPDGVVLINPAFESSRFEPIHRILEERKPCDLSQGEPRLIVPSLIIVTADNDRWTGKYFTMGRSLLTLFEGYDRTDPAATTAERGANLHAIGFNPPYETQTLALVADKPVVSPKPTVSGTSNSDSPIWVVRAPKSIVDGHTGFLYPHPNKHDPGTPYLADWLMQLYAKDCTAGPQMRGCEATYRAVGQ
jgi:pimeloyl-ACP methyl ester carboxylesterase